MSGPFGSTTTAEKAATIASLPTLIRLWEWLRAPVIQE